VALQLNVDASDNNHIYIVRFVYTQGSAWRSQSVHYLNGTKFNTIINGLENIDSDIRFFVEIQDEYGNIIGSHIRNLTVHSTLIPYLSIGLSIFLAIGAASLVTIVYKKKAHRSSIEDVTFNEETGQDEPIDPVPNE
jgi:hypothetical protein